MNTLLRPEINKEVLNESTMKIETQTAAKLYAVQIKSAHQHRDCHKRKLEEYFCPVG